MGCDASRRPGRRGGRLPGGERGGPCGRGPPRTSSPRGGGSPGPEGTVAPSAFRRRGRGGRDLCRRGGRARLAREILWRQGERPGEQGEDRVRASGRGRRESYSGGRTRRKRIAKRQGEGKDCVSAPVQSLVRVRAERSFRSLAAL